MSPPSVTSPLAFPRQFRRTDSDSSILFFANYFRMLEKVHGQKDESWKKGADSGLIFVVLSL
jgi:hypothetical protein